MSRRRQATKRPLAKDGKYQNTLVSRLVNTVMCSGKKSTAQRIVYGAFDTISEKNPASNPIEILQRAVDNAKPRIETKARRVGGATYQVPLEIPVERQNALALRWIVEFADSKKGRATPSANATKFTRWRRQTRRLHISAGKIIFVYQAEAFRLGFFVG
jgi:small subunit ribosomal protein S7